MLRFRVPSLPCGQSFDIIQYTITPQMSGMMATMRIHRSMR
jgi:hypothetical protein